MAKTFGAYKPMTFIDSVNRHAAATGSMRYAQLAADADYNGHAIRMDWRHASVCGAQWVGEYFYGERRVVARSLDFSAALGQAVEAFTRQGRGASLLVRITDGEHGEPGDFEAKAEACRAAGLVELPEGNPYDALANPTRAADWRFEAAAFRYEDRAWISALCQVDPSKVTREEFEFAHDR